MVVKNQTNDVTFYYSTHFELLDKNNKYLLANGIGFDSFLR
jgi:hypothetical protein